MEQGGTGSRINCINPPGAVIDTKCIAIAFNYRHLPLVKNKIAIVTRGTVAKGLREEKKSKRKKKREGGKGTRRKTRKHVHTHRYNETEEESRKNGNEAREKTEKRGRNWDRGASSR